MGSRLHVLVARAEEKPEVSTLEAMSPVPSTVGDSGKAKGGNVTTDEKAGVTSERLLTNGACFTRGGLFRSLAAPKQAHRDEVMLKANFFNVFIEEALPNFIGRSDRTTATERTAALRYFLRRHSQQMHKPPPFAWCLSTPRPRFTNTFHHAVPFSA